jgi:hypothetical protein
MNDNIRTDLRPVQLASGVVYWAPVVDFELRNDPPPHKPAQFNNQPPTTQRVLVEGIGCLPGQLDLF